MSAAPTHVPLLRLSIWLYSQLLCAYPPAFRREYGTQMVQVFGDRAREAVLRAGYAGLAAWWGRAALDLALTLVAEHVQALFHEETEMTREKWISLSGWALMVGALAFLAGFYIGSFEEYYFDPLGGVEAVYEYGELAGISGGLLLLSAGMIGLYLRFAAASSLLGRGGLLLAALGSLTAAATGALSAFTTSDSDFSWFLFIYSLMAFGGGLAFFGLDALRRRPLRRGNLLPLIAGMPIPTFLIGSAIYEAFTGNWLEYPEGANLIFFGVVSGGLFLLGLFMLTDREPRPAPALS